MKSYKKSKKSKNKKYQVGGNNTVTPPLPASGPELTYPADVTYGQTNLTGNFPTGTPLEMQYPDQSQQLQGKQLEMTPTDPLQLIDMSQIQVTPTQPNQDVNQPRDYNSMITLGLAGVSAGLNFNQDIQNRRRLQESIQQRDSKPLYDYNFMYGRTSTGGTEYQPIIKAEMGAQIDNRYNTPGMFNNVEIEGGEFLILPDGTTELAQGPSHSKGGINTTLPEGTKVFSNHLKPMGSKKTFAKLAKKYDNTEYDKVINDKFAKQVDRDTAMIMKQKNQKVLDKLFMDQQLMNGNSNGETMAKNGASIDNPGFRALPKAVQEQIIANMEYGGYSLPNPFYMQNGGEQTPEMKEYLEFLEFNKKARQAIGTNDKKQLEKLGFDKPYNSNDLAKDFAKLQQLRKAAGLGASEEASILFPHVGQQMRGTVNSLLGTNFQNGGYTPEQWDARVNSPEGREFYGNNMPQNMEIPNYMAPGRSIQPSFNNPFSAGSVAPSNGNSMGYTPEQWDARVNSPEGREFYGGSPSTTPINPTNTQSTTPVVANQPTSRSTTGSPNTTSATQSRTSSGRSMDELPENLRKYTRWDKNKNKFRVELPDNLSSDALTQIAQEAEQYGISNLVQSGNQRLSTSSKDYTGFYGGLKPQDYERKIVETSLGRDVTKGLNETQMREKAFELMGIDPSQYDLSDAKKLYNDKKFRSDVLYPAFTKYLPQTEFRKDQGDDFKLGLEHYDAIKGGKSTPPVTPTPDPTDDTSKTPEDTPEETPEGGTSETPDFKSATGTQEGKYIKQAFPLDQAIPGMMGLAAAQETFPYAMAQMDAPYLRPQEMNIQSQLQNIDNMTDAVIRSGGDPLTAMIQGTTAKEQAYQRKQNFDAMGRTRADMFNAQAEMQKNRVNAALFDRTYNQLYAQARDAATAEKQQAITNLISNKAKHDQSENIKKAYIDNLTSSYLVGKDSPSSFEVRRRTEDLVNYGGLSPEDALMINLEAGTAANKARANNSKSRKTKTTKKK